MILSVVYENIWVLFAIMFNFTCLRKVLTLEKKSASRNLTQLDVQENGIEDKSGSWLSCFPENFTSLEVLNFANLNTDVNFDALERLVCRCKSLKVLKANKNISLEQLQRLLVCVPQLTELGTGSFTPELTARQYAELESAFNHCKNLNTLSGLWEATALYLPVLYPACANLTFLNLSYAFLQSLELASLLRQCPRLQRLWVRLLYSQVSFSFIFLEYNSLFFM